MKWEGAGLGRAGKIAIPSFNALFQEVIQKIPHPKIYWKFMIVRPGLTCYSSQINNVPGSKIVMKSQVLDVGVLIRNHLALVQQKVHMHISHKFYINLDTKYQLNNKSSVLIKFNSIYL